MVILMMVYWLGWLHSAPPFRLNSSFIGELVLALGTGFTVPAVCFLVIMGQLSGSFLWLSVSLVLYGLVLGLSLAFPDIVRDEVFGRRNLAVILGWRRVAFLVLFLAIIAWSILVSVDMWVLPVFGLLPVFAEIYGVLRVPDSFLEADRVSVVYILSLFIFLVSFDVWLFLNV